MKFGLVVILIVIVGYYFRQDNPSTIKLLLTTMSIVGGVLINLIRIPPEKT